MHRQVSIGPWIENGFYYDFDPVEPFQEKDLRRIKKEMDKIISYKWPFVEEEVLRLTLTPAYSRIVGVAVCRGGGEPRVEADRQTRGSSTNP